MIDNVLEKLIDNVLEKLFDNVLEKSTNNVSKALFEKLFDNVFEKLFDNVFEKIDRQVTILRPLHRCRRRLFAVKSRVRVTLGKVTSTRDRFYKTPFRTKKFGQIFILKFGITSTQNNT
jgi:hypothetical protein